MRNRFLLSLKFPHSQKPNPSLQHQTQKQSAEPISIGFSGVVEPQSHRSVLGPRGHDARGEADGGGGGLRVGRLLVHEGPRHQALRPGVASPRNHMVFTPLLASTCVGHMCKRYNKL
jgi:hypothetical protein